MYVTSAFPKLSGRRPRTEGECFHCSYGRQPLDFTNSLALFPSILPATLPSPSSLFPSFSLSLFSAPPPPPQAPEFTAYRVLYYVYLQSNPKYADGDSGVLRVLAQLSDTDKQATAVRHALAVRRAAVVGNYHRLGILYREAPGEGRRIMKHFMDQARVRAMQTMVKAYKPTLPAKFVEAELGFGNLSTKDGEKVEDGEEESARSFIERVGWVLAGDEGPNGGREVYWDMKASKVDPAAAVTRTLM